MKICMGLGTRPEITKLSPKIRECERKNIEFFIIHTGQHYSKNMDSVFFEELKLVNPKYNLEVGSHSPGKQVALMVGRIEEIRREKMPIPKLLENMRNVKADATVSHY